MNGSMIKELWNGNIAPRATCGKNHSELEELIKLMEKNKIILTQTLNERQREILDKYISCTEEHECYMAEEAFFPVLALL